MSAAMSEAPATRPALSLVRPHTQTAALTAAGLQRTWHTAATASSSPEETNREPDRPPDAEMDLLHQMVPALGAALVEVLLGHRPAQTVERWVSAELYARLRTHAAVRTSLTRAGSTGTDALAGARGHRLSAVSTTAVEASLVVRTRRRSRALAMRFERARERWKLTELVSV